MPPESPSVLVVKLVTNVSALIGGMRTGGLWTAQCSDPRVLIFKELTSISETVYKADGTCAGVQLWCTPRRPVINFVATPVDTPVRQC